MGEEGLGVSGRGRFAYVVSDAGAVAGEEVVVQEPFADGPDEAAGLAGAGGGFTGFKVGDVGVFADMVDFFSLDGGLRWLSPVRLLAQLYGSNE